MLYARRLFPYRLFPPRLFPGITPPATQYTLVGPTGPAAVGTVSAPFQIRPNGNFTGSITPSDGGVGGSFIPSSLTWTDQRILQTFTYTPAAAGTISISATNDGSLSDPSPVSYLAVAIVPAPQPTWSNWFRMGWNSPFRNV